jgi:outer membrane protein OmpA-like peptidoglycan-associated protein
MPLMKTYAGRSGSSVDGLAIHSRSDSSAYKRVIAPTAMELTRMILVLRSPIMFTRFGFHLPLATALVALVTACSSPLVKREDTDALGTRLSQLQSDPQAVRRAPHAVAEAEQAVRDAQAPRADTELTSHLARIADRKIDSAKKIAQSSLAEDLHKMQSDQDRSKALDAAREIAWNDNQAAQQRADDLRRQFIHLNAKVTARGLVVTLTDLLFGIGQAELKTGAEENLSDLAMFLSKYEDRTVTIEGHTDNIGDAGTNRDLSQRRAESVKSYLVNRGIGVYRLVAVGKGENAPIASNDSAPGRQQNRRVEIVIADTTLSDAAMAPK